MRYPKQGITSAMDIAIKLPPVPPKTIDHINELPYKL